MLWLFIDTVVWKFFDRKYFIDKKIRGKIFSLMHDFLKYFSLEHILLAIIFMLVNATTIKRLTVILAFMQDEKQLSYSKRA